jgi:hypothetical protein
VSSQTKSCLGIFFIGLPFHLLDNRVHSASCLRRQNQYLSLPPVNGAAPEDDAYGADPFGMMHD